MGSGLYLVSPKPIGPAGQLDSQAGLLCHSLEVEFFLPWESSVWALETLN